MPLASPERNPTLDHLAIGVRHWPDAYDRFVHQLGGRWAIGGPVGDFTVYELYYGTGMRLEFIAPSAGNGFMRRFLDRHGPSPHHITFQVPSLTKAVQEMARMGIGTFGDQQDTPTFRALFVHPKHSGLGTLVQLVEKNDDHIRRAAPIGAGRPGDFPVPSVPARKLSLFGLTVPDLQRAHDLLAGVLRGTVTDKDDGWFFVTWGPGRSIIVRHPSVAPWDPRLWSGVADHGVGFVFFGPEALSAADMVLRTGHAVRLPPHPATGVPVWLLEEERYR